MDFDRLPAPIQKYIQGRPYQVNETGMSGSSVLMFPDMVLKTGPRSALSDGMVQVMRWLDGRLPAPRILHYAHDEEKEYLLMTRVPGKMACDKSYMNRPELLLRLLAEALQMLWQVDLSGCPRSRALDEELAHARYSLENGLVDFSRCEPETFGPGGFESPEALLDWLEENKPPLEPAFSHGDCCLLNILFDGERVSGFIDLGDSGIADKWRDLSLCYRSLKHNTNGFYGRLLPGFKPERLFDALGIAPDWDKMRYYILLDEFF
ncbi:MAG: aminoglycoside 3'-phosphotransferase [Clostridia bacterium]|nr:aminoglycoside 3'-phosphotransferase [Clostridia bacterium]